MDSQIFEFSRMTYGSSQNLFPPVSISYFPHFLAYPTSPRTAFQVQADTVCHTDR